MSQDNYWAERAREGVVLNPVDRISEILFGLIMVLTFTGAISAGTSGRQEVRELLWAALGCNVAWGLVDAMMFVMNALIERGHSVKVLKKIHQASDPTEARNALRDELTPVMASLLTDDEIDKLNDRLRKLPPPSAIHFMTKWDAVAGVQIFLLVFLCTLPVALPFAFFSEVGTALRVSNWVAVGMLFMGGYTLAVYAGFRRVVTAVLYTFIGVLLVFLTMALGG